MKLNEVLRRLKSMAEFSKHHIPWPSGELMKTVEGMAVLSELYRVCGVVPINARHATPEEVEWLATRAVEWSLKIALIYDPYRSLPADGSGDPDPAGEHGDLIRDEVFDFADSMFVRRNRGIVADFMAFDQERFVREDDNIAVSGSGVPVTQDNVHNEHMTDRLDDFWRLSRVFQPSAKVFFYADGPIPNQAMEPSKWITSATIRYCHAPRCYTPQRPEIIIKQLGLMDSDSIYPYLSLGSGYTVPEHEWKADLHYDLECDRVNARVMRDDDRVKAVNLYPQPGEPATHRYWEAFFAYAEGWV